WWQSWWFYLLCAGTAGALMYGWFWYRLQQALRLERLRVKISSDLHDDVGTLLAGLAMQTEALAITASEKDKGKLQRISETSRNAMAYMRDTVWAIDARKDKWENLLDRMREHAEETLVPREIRFDFKVENIAVQQNISVELRQNLYLIFKEAITNAAKHSNGDMLHIHLKKTPSGGLEMRICDNGTSAEKSYKTTGSGTSNMQMRAKKIGATLEIGRKAEGYCVLLQVG
ncbi:MAG: two-component system sensor with a ligand-binding domain protein, partial [Saprospiraceae bacterium]|nr:two-component system sensor with a ligand-binding domain protein [Saprospiraceae bacterium]